MTIGAALGTPFSSDYLQKGYAAVDGLVSTVFQRVDSDTLRRYNGGAMVPCIDAHHFKDLYARHVELAGTDYVAPITKPGGGVCLSESSPLARVTFNGRPVDERTSALLAVNVAVTELGVHSCALYGHFPCKACYLAGMSVADQLLALVDAKDELKAYYRDQGIELVVPILFHSAPRNADDTWGPRKTYHASSKRIREWLAAQREPQHSSPQGSRVEALIASK